MANYRDIHGFQIEVRSDNPSNPVNGQVWYNTTDSKLKGAVVSSTGAWATGGALNTGIEKSGGAGIQTSALSMGGKLPSTTNGVESYNGNSWTEIANLNTARNALGGAGASNTSAIAFG